VHSRTAVARWWNLSRLVEERNALCAMGEGLLCWGGWSLPGSWCSKLAKRCLLRAQCGSRTCKPNYATAKFTSSCFFSSYVLQTPLQRLSEILFCLSRLLILHGPYRRAQFLGCPSALASSVHWLATRLP